MKAFFRALLSGVCMLAAATAALVAVIGASIFAALTSVRVQGNPWTDQDDKAYLTSLVMLGAGGFVTWGSHALSQRLRDKNAGKARAVRAAPTKSGLPSAQHRSSGFLLAIWLAIFCGWMWCRSPVEDPAARAARIALAAGAIWLGLHLFLLLHELGHLLAARLARMEVDRVRLGAGPLVWRSQPTAPDGLLCEWRLWPAIGFTLAWPRQEKGFRWRQWQAAAGGPLVDGVLLGAGYFWIKQRYGDLPTALAPAAGTAGVVAGALFALGAVFAVSNLLLATPGVGEFPRPADGTWLWRLPRASDKRISEWAFWQCAVALNGCLAAGADARAWAIWHKAEAYHAKSPSFFTQVEAALRQRQNDFSGAAECLEDALRLGGLSAEPRAQIQFNLTALWLKAGQTERARAVCQDILEAAPTAERIAALDQLACLPIMTPDAKALLPDAMRWIDEAIALAPERETLRGTRASLLAEQGQFDEAEPMLRQLFAEGKTASDRGISAFYLALIARRRNAPEPEWRRWRNEAVRLHPEEWLLERARRDLA